LAASIVVYCSPDIANIYRTVRVEGKFVHEEGLAVHGIFF